MEGVLSLPPSLSQEKIDTDTIWLFTIVLPYFFSAEGTVILSGFRLAMVAVGRQWKITLVSGLDEEAWN